MAREYNVSLDGVQASDVPMVVVRDLANLFVEGLCERSAWPAEGRSHARGTPRMACLLRRGTNGGSSGDAPRAVETWWRRFVHLYAAPACDASTEGVTS